MAKNKFFYFTFLFLILFILVIVVLINDKIKKQIDECYSNLFIDKGSIENEYKKNFYKNNRLLEEINVKDILKPYDDLLYSILTYSDIQFEDINFDGYLDRGLYLETGNVNTTYAYWVFDEKEDKFIFLGEYFKFDIDYENKQLKSSSRSNCCSYTDEIYKINENNKIVLLKKETNELLLYEKEDKWATKTINMPEEKNYVLDVKYQDINNEDKYIKVYGTAIDKDKYIPKKLEIYKNNKIIQTIILEEIEEIKNNINYTVYQDFNFKILDINFDGYFDIGLAIKDNNDYGDIYAYYLWDNNKNSYQYFDVLPYITIYDKKVIQIDSDFYLVDKNILKAIDKGEIYE